MPRIWSDSIRSHRQAVREAVLDAAGDVARREGLLALTMSRLAEASGIGRATLYKYFADVESVVAAWHERQIDRHVATLRDLAASSADADRRLSVVLEAYATMAYEDRSQHSVELSAALHSDTRTRAARMGVHQIVRDLIAEGIHSGRIRDDVNPDELAAFALHAVAAAGALASRAGVRRLVEVTMSALRAQSA